MGLPILERPILLGTAHSGVVTSLDAFQATLTDRYKVKDLDTMDLALGSKPAFELEIAVADLGEVSMVSVRGTALTLSLDPLHSLAMLALPSDGWGQYQMDDHKIDNTVGRSIAYIPSRSWRLVNDATGGTSLQFQEQALIRRMQVIAADLNLTDAAALLAAPFAVELGDPMAQGYYRNLLGALDIVDSSYRYNAEPPNPILRLDDLILRCIALLIFPSLSFLDSCFSERISKRDLQHTIKELMDWLLANLHTPISLSDIEAQAGYGRRAIQQGFKAEVGCGPMQWLRKQRLYLAYDKVRAGDAGLTVSQVAKSCGYLNLASFSRDFNECFHVSASTMLRQARRGQSS